MQFSCWCKLSLRFEVRKANRVDQDNGCDVCTLECAPDPRFSHAQRSSSYAVDNCAVFYIPNGRVHSKRIRLRSRRYRRKVCGQRPTASRILHLRPSLQETFYKWYFLHCWRFKDFLLLISFNSVQTSEEKAKREVNQIFEASAILPKSGSLNI